MHQFVHKPTNTCIHIHILSNMPNPTTSAPKPPTMLAPLPLEYKVCGKSGRQRVIKSARLSACLPGSTPPLRFDILHNFYLYFKEFFLTATNAATVMAVDGGSWEWWWGKAAWQRGSKEIIKTKLTYISFTFIHFTAICRYASCELACKVLLRMCVFG